MLWNVARSGVPLRMGALPWQGRLHKGPFHLCHHFALYCLIRTPDPLLQLEDFCSQSARDKLEIKATFGVTE